MQLEIRFWNNDFEVQHQRYLSQNEALNAKKRLLQWSLFRISSPSTDVLNTIIFFSCSGTDTFSQIVFITYVTFLMVLCVIIREKLGITWEQKFSSLINYNQNKSSSHGENLEIVKIEKSRLYERKKRSEGMVIFGFKDKPKRKKILEGNSRDEIDVR